MTLTSGMGSTSVTPKKPQTPLQGDFELVEKVSAWDAKLPG